MRFPRLGVLLILSLLVSALAAACGSNSPSSAFTPGQDAATGDGTTGDGSSSGDGPTLLGDDGGDDSGDTLVIQPQNQAIAVVYGQQTPVVNFTATVHGAMVHASFTIDRGEIGSVVASTGVMTPTGTLGGTANVTASYAGQTATTPITVVLHLTDNGAPAGSDAGGGTGGIGGVGGSGTGGPVSMSTQMALQGTPTADPGLAWLYPYDQTVWPRGVLAPLLQWSPPTAAHAYDGIFVQLQETGFQYQGYFAANATPFVNTLIPETAWQVLEYSNMGEPVTVTLVFSSGGTAYGPLTASWTIAQGTLTGTVYYNSYGTALVTNFCSGVSWESGSFCFGGATLAIKHGATSPTLVAGTNSPSGDQSGCRVCHSVAAQGSTLVTQHGDNYEVSSSYALTSGNAETAMPGGTGQFAFAGISPDGTFLISDAADMPATSVPGTSGLFSIPSGAPIASTGLPSGFGAGTPVFSPDAKHVAFNDYTTNSLALATMPFTQSTNTFGTKVTLHTSATTFPDLFPAFLPTNDAVIFEEETASDGEFGATRDGTMGELWWVDLATQTAAPLANLNGVGYLPTGPNHMADQTLNYEPTVNPVPSGGYAWVVFTSRRMYGNVATQDPFLSDPRDYNPALSATTKKLWVAAIDLNAKPGTDPSHPAFYLPAQELLAGNSRGYWVVDPCEPNGDSCITGDQCCSGYCQDVDGGFVCGTQPPGCSALSNKCMTSSDCCGYAQGIQCIDGFCAQPTPQ